MDIPKQDYTPDSDGRGPTKPPGTRVQFLKDKIGTVLYQKHHYDGWESFYGNVLVQEDDTGKVYELNGWQTFLIKGSCRVSTFETGSCFLGTKGCNNRSHQMELF